VADATLFDFIYIGFIQWCYTRHTSLLFGVSGVDIFVVDWKLAFNVAELL
jgi:hypothetical protein